jgi:ankyrin repeat protein
MLCIADYPCAGGHVADLNQTARKGQTALHFAAQGGHQSVAMTLLEYGASAYVMGSHGLPSDV